MSFDRKRKRKLRNSFCDSHGIGSLVRSRSGRTRGSVFAVVATETDAKGCLYAIVSDGRTRPLSHPKRKSAAHLETLLPAVGRTPFGTDEDIRCAIEALADSKEFWRD